MNDIEEKHLKLLSYFEETDEVYFHNLSFKDDYEFAEVYKGFSDLISSNNGFHYLLCDGDFYQIQPRGKDRFAELKLKKQYEIEKEKREESKDSLELEVKQLQKLNLEFSNDKMIFEKTIRELQTTNLNLNNEKLVYEGTIRDLREELLVTNILKNHWYLWAASIGLGIAIAKWILHLF